jgi:hypothetical protein
LVTMTRTNKINLLKLSLSEPSDDNKEKYEAYRNLYNKLIRLSKKFHIENQINSNKKKSKINVGYIKGKLNRKMWA